MGKDLRDNFRPGSGKDGVPIQPSAAPVQVAHALVRAIEHPPVPALLLELLLYRPRLPAYLGSSKFGALNWVSNSWMFTVLPNLELRTGSIKPVHGSCSQYWKSAASGGFHQANSWLKLLQSLPVYVPPPPNRSTPIDTLDEARRSALEVRGECHRKRPQWSRGPFQPFPSK
ncbi:MAG: hypothetical protein Q9173_002000 [Seirophora scorigena]